MRLRVQISREEDGRYIGEVPQLRGCLVYGETKAEATKLAKALALYILSDQLEHGERTARSIAYVEFEAA